MARIPSVAASFELAAAETLEALQKQLVEIATTEHAKILKADPKPSSYKQFVDGREGAPFSSVEPMGVIYVVYDRLQEVVDFALETLRSLSPVLSGAYRDSHTLIVNGTAAADLAGWDGGAIYIANPLPYARKIEMGKMKMRVPGSDHVYQQAEKIVARRFGNIAAVKFTYVPLVGGGLFSAGGQAGPIVRGAKERDARRPALYIRSYASLG